MLNFEIISNSNNMSIMQLPRNVLYFIISCVTFVPLYFTNYHWVPTGRQRASLDRILDTDASMFQSSMRQWRLTVAKMVNILKYIRAGSTLTLSYVPLITTSVL